MWISQKEVHFLLLTWDTPLHRLLDALPPQEKERLIIKLPFLDKQNENTIFEIADDFDLLDSTDNPFFIEQLKEFTDNLRTYCDAHAYATQNLATPPSPQTIDSSMLLNCSTAAAMGGGIATCLFGLVTMNHIIAFTGLAVTTKSAIGYVVTKGAMRYAENNRLFASTTEHRETTPAMVPSP